MPTCPYCADAPQLPEQIYETKLFRVLVARDALANGHVMIVPKAHDPHFYSFTPDAFDEFGYLVKKVSFWAMRFSNASGFSLLMNDGSTEVATQDHLMIHIVPRFQQDLFLTTVSEPLTALQRRLDDATVDKTVKELQNLMQLPQGD